MGLWVKSIIGSYFISTSATAATYQIEAFLFPNSGGSIEYNGFLVLDDTPTVNTNASGTEYQFHLDALSLSGTNGSQNWTKSELTDFHLEIVHEDFRNQFSTFYYLPLPTDPSNPDAKALLDGRSYLQSVTAQVDTIDSLDFDILDSAPVEGSNGVYGELGVHIIGSGIQFQRGLSVVNLGLVPEPSTLGLLGLATLTSLRRRRPLI